MTPNSFMVPSTGNLWSLTEVSCGTRLVVPSLTISEGVTALVGVSGAGKTTLLNLLVGFEKNDSGKITHPPESLGWGPARFGLWPHLTLHEHLTTVCSNKPLIEEWLGRFDLIQLKKKYPQSLSQGEQSRLTVLRAILTDARILVLDEPLVHVDPIRGPRYLDALVEYCRAHGKSLVFSTHQPERVLAYAERVVCLDQGQIVYSGAVAPLYLSPCNRQQAEFLGPINWFTAEEAQNWLPIADRPEVHRSGSSSFGIRPEALDIVEDEKGEYQVLSSRFEGSVARTELGSGHKKIGRAFVHRPPRQIETGTRVRLTWLASLLFCFCGCGGSEPILLPIESIEQEVLPEVEHRIPAPRSLRVSPEGEIYVLDNAGRVLVYDQRLNFLRKWWMPEYKVGRPEGLCFRSNGTIVVCNTHYGTLVVFDSQGKHLDTLGKRGTGPGEFFYPVGITEDPQGNLYVCEYGRNDRIQKLSPEGRPIWEAGGLGTNPGEFQRPSGIVWDRGLLYVADAMNNRIQVFDEEGTFIRVLVSPETGGKLDYPYDLALGPDGKLYAAEFGGGRVSVYNLEGEFCGFLGKRGAGFGEMTTPWGAAPMEGKVYVADTGNRRILELSW